MTIKKHPVYSDYGADPGGNLYSFKRGSAHKIKPIHNHNGYTKCTLVGTHKPKNILIHRFVWECFNGLIPENLFINHINSIRDDNKVSNLELCTKKENSQHAVGKGRMSSGKNHYNYKYTDEEVEQIRSIKGWSQQKIGDLYGITQQSVWYLLNRRNT